MKTVAPRLVTAALVGIALAVLGLAPAKQDDKLRITVAKGRLSIAIAVPAFADTSSGRTASEAAAEITGVVKDDLKMAGIFNLADRVVYEQIPPHTERAVPFDSYARFGVETVALGNVRAVGDDLEVEIRLFDVSKKAMIFGKRLRGRPEQRRRVAHRIATHILYHLTGETGIFESRIVFTSTRGLDTSSRPRTEIWVMDYDGHNQLRVTYSDSLKLFPWIGPGDSGIVYTSYINNNPDVYRLSLGGGTAEKVVASASVDMTPSISPDGTRIAFASSMNGNMDIYVSNIDGSGVRRLTTSWAIDSSPCWSPDGRRIAFSSSRTGTPQIYIMDIDGSNMRRITFEGRYNDGANWSPDGTMIAYAARRTDSKTFDIRIHELTANQTFYVTRDVANDEDPTWSPDGRYLAFSSDRNGSYQIYIISVDGKDMRQITRLGVNKHPSWSR